MTAFGRISRAEFKQSLWEVKVVKGRFLGWMALTLVLVLAPTARADYQELGNAHGTRAKPTRRSRSGA